MFLKFKQSFDCNLFSSHYNYIIKQLAYLLTENSVQLNNLNIGFIYKRNINTESVEKFNKNLYEIDWNQVKSFKNPSESYEIYLPIFLSIYNAFFTKKKIKVRSKYIQSPWIKAEIKK